MVGMLADFEVSYARFQLCILFLDCACCSEKNICIPVKRYLREMVWNANRSGSLLHSGNIEVHKIVTVASLSLLLLTAFLHTFFLAVVKQLKRLSGITESSFIADYSHKLFDLIIHTRQTFHWYNVIYI